MRRVLWCVVVLLTASLGHGAPPAPGALLVVGGGSVPEGARARALALTGAAAPVVAILPQASALEDRGQADVAAWREAGAKEAVLCDPLDDAARRALARADLIWIPGGAQDRLMHALGDAGLVEAIRARRAAGAVVGGTSAGAAVMSARMLTGKAELTSLTSGATELAAGLGLWPEAIVDQHFVARQRNNRLLSAVLDHPDLLGVGIDEGTAVLVGPDTLEVLGAGSVLVYDARGASVAPVAPGARHGATGLTLQVLRAGMTLRWARGD